MKFLCCGDFHLDEKKPKNRTESYVKDQRDKILWILNLAKKENCYGILQPGDFCNTSKLSDGFKTQWINIFNHHKIPIYTVPGQHDMRFHSSNIQNTPLGVLNAADVLEIVCMPLRPGIGSDVVLYGAGWEQDIPTIIGDPTETHILLLHRMVSSSPLWPGHEGYVTPKWLFNHTDFDLIVCGDNHKHFLSVKEKQLLVNCGSLMRSSIDQADHKPIVYIYNTDSRSIKGIDVPIKPFEEVMHVAEAKKEKERNKELEDFVEGLSDTNIEGLDFKKNLIDHLTKNKDVLSKGIIAIIEEVIG